MDWLTDGMIIMALAIIGAGLIAGGVVSYRGSARVGVRAFGASAVAVGVVMWAVVAFTAPVSVSYSGEGPSPPPVVEAVRAAN